MITLPQVTTAAAKVASTSISGASSSADAATDIAAAGSNGDSTQAGGTQGFLALLGNKLLTLAKQGEAAAQTPAGTAITTAATAEEAEAGQSPKAKLNALLAALDKPDTLNALMKPAKEEKLNKESETATDTDNSDTTATLTSTLSNSDMQALQALFAMLPPAGAQPVATAKGGDLLESNGNIKGNGQATLASLLSGTTVKGEDATESDVKNDKLAGSATLSTTSASQKTPTETTTAFQQVLGQVSKDNEKENSVATPTMTHNVLSAASAAITPTTTSAVSAPPTPQLNAQLGSPEWQQALGQQVLMFSRNGQQSAELHLHPQDLGSIQISLKLDSDQAQLSMVSNHSQVRAALEAALPQLRTALAENGINLGQSTVSSDAFQQGQSFTGQQEQQRNNSRGNTFNLAADNDGDVTAIAVPASLRARAAGSSAVDIFA